METRARLLVPYALQENPYFCGPATLSLVARYFGITRSQQELAVLAGTNPTIGTKCSAMASTGRQIGLWALESWHATMRDLRTLIDVGVPPIIYVYEPEAPDLGHGILDHMHFYVVTGYGRRSLTIHDTDPALDGGSIHGLISEETILARWTSEKGSGGRWMLGLSKKQLRD